VFPGWHGSQSAFDGLLMVAENEKGAARGRPYVFSLNCWLLAADSLERGGLAPLFFRPWTTERVKRSVLTEKREQGPALHKSVQEISKDFSETQVLAVRVATGKRG